MSTGKPTENFRIELQCRLKPYFDMLSQRFHQRPFQEWLSLVMHTRSSIVRAPEQYVGKEVPSPEALNALVADMFDHFLSQYEPVPNEHSTSTVSSEAVTA